MRDSLFEGIIALRDQGYYHQSIKHLLEGKDRYSQNLDLLVPFFDSPSLKLEKIEKGRNHDVNFILAVWKLRTCLKLPWRPLISIRGSTTYNLDEEFKIIRHAEIWDISALEAVGQIFTLGSSNVDQ